MPSPSYIRSGSRDRAALRPPAYAFLSAAPFPRTFPPELIGCIIAAGAHVPANGILAGGKFLTSPGARNEFLSLACLVSSEWCSWAQRMLFVDNYLLGEHAVRGFIEAVKGKGWENEVTRVRMRALGKHGNTGKIEALLAGALPALASLEIDGGVEGYAKLGMRTKQDSWLRKATRTSPVVDRVLLTQCPALVSLSLYHTSHLLENTPDDQVRPALELPHLRALRLVTTDASAEVLPLLEATGPLTSLTLVDANLEYEQLADAIVVKAASLTNLRFVSESAPSDEAHVEALRTVLLACTRLERLTVPLCALGAPSPLAPGIQHLELTVPAVERACNPRLEQERALEVVEKCSLALRSVGVEREVWSIALRDVCTRRGVVLDVIDMGGMR